MADRTRSVIASEYDHLVNERVLEPRRLPRVAPQRLARLEHNRGRDRPAVEQIETVFLARTVAKAPAVHQRRRAATVEIQSVCSAERQQRIGELGKRHAGIVPGPTIACHCEQPIAGDRQRSTGIAPTRNIGIELMGGRREPLPVLSINQRPPAISDQQRPGLQQIAAQITGQPITPGDPRNPINDMHACPNVTPRRVERYRRSGAALDLDLAERQTIRSREEPADNGMTNIMRLAPAHQRRGPLKHHHTRRDRQSVITRDVQRRAGPVAQRHTHPAKP
jgi:hypothetical protein